jgi:hypothetical protein
MASVTAKVGIPPSSDGKPDCRDFSSSTCEIEFVRQAFSFLDFVHFIMINRFRGHVQSAFSAMMALGGGSFTCKTAMNSAVSTIYNCASSFMSILRDSIKVILMGCPN